jgi:hypothetical protein
MQTLRDIAPYAALAGIALAFAVLVLVILLWTSVRRLRRAQIVVMGYHEQRDIVDHVEHLDSQVRNLREAVEILTDQLDGHKRHLDQALTNRAIVRYNAFRDAGGEQSASIALLDNHRSGVVISAIAARDFARIYVKHLHEGVADRDLSPEESQAVAAAVPRPLAAAEHGSRGAPLPRRGDAAGPPGGDAPRGSAADAAPTLTDVREAAPRSPEPTLEGATITTPAPATTSTPTRTPTPDADAETFTWESGDARPGRYGQRPPATGA